MDSKLKLTRVLFYFLLAVSVDVIAMEGNDDNLEKYESTRVPPLLANRMLEIDLDAFMKAGLDKLSALGVAIGAKRKREPEPEWHPRTGGPEQKRFHAIELVTKYEESNEETEIWDQVCARDCGDCTAESGWSAKIPYEVVYLNRIDCVKRFLTSQFHSGKAATESMSALGRLYLRTMNIPISEQAETAVRNDLQRIKYQKLLAPEILEYLESCTYGSPLKAEFPGGQRRSLGQLGDRAL